ncbi:MAG: oligosaccharide flippase family protein [Candidatus Latescibacterota bacterium]|nr:oligosaccharide flippase family protein [Candidatus Latescibacterota bacterium]
MSESSRSSHSLATLAVRGVFWTGSPFVLQLLATLLFYRFIPVGQMGNFEFALILVMLLSLLTDLGLGSALVQFHEAEERHFSAAFCASLLTGGAVTAVVLISANQLSQLLASKDPETFHRVLSSLIWMVPFASVSGIFRARLQRELDFRRISLAEIASGLLHFASAGALLITGYSLMSPVWSAVAREAGLLLGLVVATRWLPRLQLDLDALRRILRFGLELTGARCLNFMGSNLARLLIFPVLGDAANGHYNFAYRLTLQPLVRASTVITRVFFPTFSVVQEDDPLLRRAYLRTVQAVALVYWPALAALFIFAPDVVALSGEEMVPALWPLRLLAVATLIKAVGMTVGSVFLAKGRSNWALYWSMFTLVVLLPSLYFAVAFGVTSVSATVAVTAVVFLALSQHLTNRLIGLSFGDYLGALLRPALVTAFVLGTLWLLHPWAPSAPVGALLTAVVTTTVAVALALRLFAWQACLALWHNARG